MLQRLSNCGSFRHCTSFCFLVFSSEKKVDSNCIPWSAMIMMATQRRGIHSLQMVSGHDCAVTSFRSIALGSCVNGSVIVRQYLLPCESRKGPTRRRYMVWKRFVDVGNIPTSFLACLVILHFRHAMHCLVQGFAPFFMDGQKSC